MTRLTFLTLNSAPQSSYGCNRKLLGDLTRPCKLWSGLDGIKLKHGLHFSVAYCAQCTLCRQRLQITRSGELNAGCISHTQRPVNGSLFGVTRDLLIGLQQRCHLRCWKSNLSKDVNLSFCQEVEKQQHTLTKRFAKKYLWPQFMPLAYFTCQGILDHILMQRLSAWKPQTTHAGHIQLKFIATWKRVCPSAEQHSNEITPVLTENQHFSC